MAASLIKLYRKDKWGWIHIDNYLSGLNIKSSMKGGDNSKLRHWGLLEKQMGRRNDGSERVGYYRLTSKGRGFVQGILTVQKYALLFNSECYGLDGDFVNIHECLGSHFNYDELMRGE
jgi:hypothetical protein